MRKKLGYFFLSARTGVVAAKDSCNEKKKGKNTVSTEPSCLIQIINNNGNRLCLFHLNCWYSSSANYCVTAPDDRSQVCHCFGQWPFSFRGLNYGNVVVINIHVYSFLV